MSDGEEDKSVEEFFAKKSKGKRSKSKSKAFTTAKDIADKKSKTKGKKEEKTETAPTEVSQVCFLFLSINLIATFPSLDYINLSEKHGNYA